LSSKQRQKRRYCQTCVCSRQGLGGQMDRFLLRPCAVLVAAALAQLCLSVKGVAQQPASQLVTLQPDPASDVLPFYRDWTKSDEPALSREQTIEHLRAAIKYVFVIFQENESFDHYFGTFPAPMEFTRTASIRARPRIHQASPKHIRISAERR
jgi:phospholipase C